MITKAKLHVLPPAKDRNGTWPQGWWLRPQTTRYSCCHGVGHEVAPGARIYLTGEIGEVYCEKHAERHDGRAGTMTEDAS